MAGLDQFMNALAGFGAGVQGQGQQFLEAQNKHKRLEALAGYGRLLNEGEIDQTQYLSRIGEIDPELGAKIALQRLGVDAPADVKSWQYRNSLPADQQPQFDAYRRNQQVIDLGGVYGVVGPNGSVTPIAQKSIPPAQLPETKSAQATAIKDAEAAAAARAEANKKGVQASNMLDLAAEAKEILPQASSGSFQALGAAAKGLVGMSDESTQANRRLAVISAGLVANVPRMEGPQSDTDVAMYREAAGAVGDSSIPYEDRLAALGTIEALQQKYIDKAPAAPAAAPASSKRGISDYTDDELRAIASGGRAQ